jgi:hypothetical protein
MSRKAARQQVGVALFPFLAVLICTMGALIVLLVLLVQQARVDASTIVAKQIGGGAEGRLRERLEDAQWQRELLDKSRAEKTEELAQSRARLAHLEEHTQRLEGRAKELLERAKSIDEGKKLRDEDLATARAEAERLKTEIDQKKKDLDEAKKKSRDGQEWYALIPYNGPAGTRRRPIYVECTEFGVIIQPEGLLLSAQDFSGPMGPGNPLDVALRAAREHLERTLGDKAGQPYPLLVVRPSGVVAFGAARSAIKAWDDEWGYELISDEKHLDFGPPDPALSAALSKQVTVARQRQAAMIAMMPRRYASDEPLKSFAAEDVVQQSAQQRSVGGASGGLGSGPGPGGGAGYGGNGRGSGLPGDSGYPGPAGTGIGGGRPPGPRAARGDYGGAAGSSGGQAGTSAGPPGAGGQSSGLPSAIPGTSGAGRFGQGFASGGSGSGNGVGTSGGTGAGTFPGSPLNGGGTGGSDYGSSGGQTGGEPSLGSASGQPLAGGGQYESGSGSGKAGQPGGSPSTAGGGGLPSVMSAGGQAGGSSLAGSGMSPAGGQIGMPSPNLNFDFGSAKSAPSNPSAGSSTTSPGRSPPRSGASRGNNWALPGVQPHQIGVTRPIRISIQPDRIVMLPERGDNRVAQVVKIAPELTPDDVNHFVAAVQSEVKGWGLAVADGYWKPVLQAEVAPGAERHFLNLETALHGSGIDVTRRSP